MLFEDCLAIACSGVANLSWPGSQETEKMGGTKGQWVLKHSIYDFMDVMSIPHATHLIFAFFDPFLNILIVCIYPQNPVLTVNSSVVAIQRQNHKMKPSRISLSVTVLCYPEASVRLKLSTPDTYC